jgi:hypothetical protein
MALQFVNIVKAQITQTLLSTLLIRGGYRVTRLGIEELFGEIKYLDLPTYMALNLPLQLRYLPDLLVADGATKNAYLVEVKFRQKFTDASAKDIHKELCKQRQHWPESYAVVMIAEPFVVGGRFHQDYIRIVRPQQTDMLVSGNLTPQQRWESLPQLYHVFRGLNETWLLYNADSMTPALCELSQLQEKWTADSLFSPSFIHKAH